MQEEEKWERCSAYLREIERGRGVVPLRIKLFGIIIMEK